MRLKAQRRAQRKRQEAEQPLYMHYYRSVASYMSKGTRLFQTGIVAASILVVFVLALLTEKATTAFEESQQGMGQLMEKAGQWMDNTQSVDPAFMRRYMTQKLIMEQQRNEQMRTSKEQELNLRH